MKPAKTRALIRLLFLFTLIAPASAEPAQWIPPTAEELTMTSQPQVPGAAAVYLNREEIIDDQHGEWSVYVRLKVLTERGKDYASVELKQYQDSFTIKDVAGRTILRHIWVVEVNGKAALLMGERGLRVHLEEIAGHEDAVRIKLPAGLSMESLPTAEKLPFKSFAIYSLTSESGPTTVTVRRDFLMGNILFGIDEYPALRAFYGKFETKDQEPIVLKAAATPPATKGELSGDTHPSTGKETHP
jgi:hypothetical protein